MGFLSSLFGKKSSPDPEKGEQRSPEAEKRWKDAFARIQEEARAAGAKLNRGATVDEVWMFRHTAEKILGGTPPHPYMEALGVVNGLTYNGTAFFGIDMSVLKERPNQQIAGIIGNNQHLYEIDERLTPYIFYAQSSTSWYVYEMESGKYHKLDLPSANKVETFDTFDELMDRLFADMLEENDEDDE